MADVASRLAAALADRYRLERELGTGGMATVYLAEDLKHRRHVAIKVLRSELADALGPERFLREIEISAKLDHPHILPLYDSGEADGFLYYVMPFVEGESLRDRLAREKQLPVDEAIQIALEVADALSYAHSRAVVHRDIKPANILLAGGHARVADFGIARAISEAGGDRLTASGLAIGTPAYMSPEQAAGSTDLDGRSDLYSLACVLYEMLAGQPPFTGATAESVVHQHLTAESPPITTVRPAVPARVSDILQRALSKTPADRFSPAAQFAEALRPAMTSATHDRAGEVVPPRAPPRMRWRPVAAGVLVAAVLLLGGWLAARTLGLGRSDTLIGTGAMAQRERVIIADFENRTSDSVVGATVTELMRVGLSRSTAVSLVDPLQVVRILEFMRRDPADGLPPEVALEAAEREGIGAVVTGEVSQLGTGYALAGRIVSAATGEVLVAQQVAANGPDELVGAVDQLSSRLRERIGESLASIRRNEPLDRVTTPSMAALRLYSQGMRAWSQGDIARAVDLMEEAIAADTTFAMAYRKLAVILSNQFERRSQQIEAATQAYRYRDRLTDRERYTVIAAYHTLVTGNRDQVIAAYRNVLDLHPDDHLALNNLGVVYSQMRDYERAAEYYSRGLRTDSTNRLLYSNLASTLGQQRKWDSAAAVIEHFERRFSGNPQLIISKIINAALRKAYDEARQLGDSLVEAERGRVFWEATAHEWMATLSAMRGQMGEARRQWREAMDVTAARGLRGQYLFRSARRAIIESLIEGDPTVGRRVLDDAVRRFPLASLSPLDRPYAHLALARASVGDLERARTLLAEYEQTADADHSEQTEVWKHAARGVAALAEQRVGDAIEQFWLFDEGIGCSTCSYAWLARAYDQAGRTDSAAVLMEQFVNTPSSAVWYDAAHLAHGYQRLARHYEERGNAEKAAEYYSRFIDLWQFADPEFQPAVTQAKEALRRLTAEPIAGSR